MIVAHPNQEDRKVEKHEEVEIGRMPNGQTIGEFWRDLKADVEIWAEKLDALSAREPLPSFPRWLFGCLKRR